MLQEISLHTTPVCINELSLENMKFENVSPSVKDAILL